jgi:hypothetical protein
VYYFPFCIHLNYAWELGVLFSERGESNKCLLFSVVNLSRFWDQKMELIGNKEAKIKIIPWAQVFSFPELINHWQLSNNIG